MEWEPREPREGINVSPTHPLVELSTLLGGVVAATVVLVLVAGFAVDLAIRLAPVDFEQRVLAGLWSDRGEGVSHPRAGAARALLARMAAHWPGNPYAQIPLRVIADDDPNAFALPGGAVALTAGLLDAVESENELAFVLGHELGHFRGRDHLRGIGRALVVRLTLAALVGGREGEALTSLVATWTETGFARDQERRADAFALELVRAEYGHVGGADAFFRRLPDADADLADRVAGYVSTHPVTESRIDALRTTAHARHYPLAGPLTPLPQGGDVP